MAVIRTYLDALGPGGSTLLVHLEFLTFRMAMPFYGVPTNAELEANAPDAVFEAVRNWLWRHPTPRSATLIGPAYKAARKEWLDWAANNLINDPEIRGAFKKEYNAATE